MADAQAAELQREYPDIDLRLHTSTEIVDFLRSDVQAAVRFGLGDWPQLHAEKVLDEWLVPVCTKTLLAKHGPIRSRDDLRRIPLLHSLSEPWAEWPDIQVASESWGTRRFVVRRFRHRGARGRSRPGVRAGPVEPGVSVHQDGRLVLASPRIVKAPRSYYFVCPPSLHRAGEGGGVPGVAARRGGAVAAARPQLDRSCSASAVKSLMGAEHTLPLQT